jgi:hypothetical protein
MDNAMRDHRGGEQATSGVDDLLRSEPRVVNIGLAGFSDDLQRARIKTVHVNWSPPAASNPRILSLLAKLSS